MSDKFHNFSWKFIKGDNSPGVSRSLPALNDQLSGGIRKSRESPAAMKPANAWAENRVPVTVA
jgi:hypothetical protein